jgi:hypothetical protein
MAVRMIATTELPTSTNDLEANRRQEDPGSSSNDLEGRQSNALFDRFFGDTKGALSPVGTARFLTHATISHSANNSLRTISLERAQQSYGNRFVQRAVTAAQHESAASRSVQRQCSCGGTCEECRALAHETPPPETLLRSQSSGNSAQTSPGLTEADVVPTGSPGAALDDDTRLLMESRFGTDFRDVRVHSDARASVSAEALGANAYTTGRDIYFAAGKYAPSTREGRHLLAHELAHTVQQGKANSPGHLNTQPSNAISVSQPSDPLEREAERVSDEIREGLTVNPSGRIEGSNHQILRQVENAPDPNKLGPCKELLALIKEAVATLIQRANDLLNDPLGLQWDNWNTPKIFPDGTNAGSVVGHQQQYEGWRNRLRNLIDQWKDDDCNSTGLRVPQDARDLVFKPAPQPIPRPRPVQSPKPWDAPGTVPSPSLAPKVSAAAKGAAIGAGAGLVLGGILGAVAGATGGTLVAPGFGTVGGGIAGAVEGAEVGAPIGAAIGTGIGSLIGWLSGG